MEERGSTTYNALILQGVNPLQIMSFMLLCGWVWVWIHTVVWVARAGMVCPSWISPSVQLVECEELLKSDW